MILGFFAPMRSGADPETWGPMLKIDLSDSLYLSNSNIVAKDLLALADTGADNCYIDNAIAKRFSLKERETGKLSTGVGSTISTVFEGQIIIGGAFLLQVPLIGSDFLANGFLQNFLIGMTVLRHFDMTIRRQSSIFSLSWVNQ